MRMPRIFENVRLRGEASSADGQDAPSARSSRPRRSSYWVGAVSAGLAVLFALALLWRFPPFLDEAIYSGWTARIADDPSERFVPLANGKEPLFEWLAATITTLGIGAFTAGRLISVVTWFGTIALVAAVGWVAGGRRVALASGFLSAICPFLVVYGVLGLYEALATFLVTATLLLQILLARTLRLDVALLLGASFGLGLLTKQSTLMAFALWPVSLVLIDWSRPALGARLARLTGLALLSAGVAFALASILRLSEFYDDLGRLRKELYPVHSISDALSTPGAWLEQNWPAYRDVIGTYVTPAVILVAAVGVGLGLRRRAPLTVVLVAWVLVPLVTAALLADAPYPRYVHVVAPPLLVLAAMGCGWTADVLSAWLRPRTGRDVAPFALPLVVGVVALQPLLFDARLAVDPSSVTYPGLDEEQFVTGWPAGTGLKAMRRELEGRAGRSGATTILLGPQAPGWLSFAMRNDTRFSFVSSDSDQPGALLALENGAALPPRSDALSWGPVRRVERPRNGVPLVLYESGVRFRGRFVASPEELRRLIVPDARFDEYIAQHPAVKSWLEAWYDANG